MHPDNPRIHDSLGKDTPNRRPVEKQPCPGATVISNPPGGKYMRAFHKTAGIVSRISGNRLIAAKVNGKSWTSTGVTVKFTWPRTRWRIARATANNVRMVAARCRDPNEHPMSIFMQLLPFDPASVAEVPRAPGVYIIRLRDGTPFYVGRSRQDINERLWRHVTGTGSRKVMEALSKHTPLEFEYQQMISVEQAEAMLIRELGTIPLGNLRRETDPADW